MNPTLAFIVVILMGALMMLTITLSADSCDDDDYGFDYDLDRPNSISNPNTLFTGYEMIEIDPGHFHRELVFYEPDDWIDLENRIYYDLNKEAPRRSALIDWEDGDWLD